MFKRFWQRGYKGHFAAFHWDTWWHDSAGWVPYLGIAIDSYLANYNDSERIAWQSAAALTSVVNSMPFENKHLVAHSMGNIVAGEALRHGMQVKNYALLHGAVPAACYDEGAHIEQTTEYDHHAGPLFLRMWDNQTPDNDSDSMTRVLAYRGRLMNVSGNLINFFLAEDYATSFAWEVNNDQTKPPHGPLAKNYQYQRDYPNGHKLFSFGSYDPYQQIYNGMMPLSDPYESMPFACRTWGKAVGAFERTAGSIQGSVNLGSSDYQLPGEDSGFGDEHSAEFNFSIQPLQPFYATLLQSLDVDFLGP
jgi:hypothetical protein